MAYRLALDHPGAVTKLALLDILPTFKVWENIEAGRAEAAHWGFLAEPAPQPETEIGKAPTAYFEGLMAKWTKAGSLAPFRPQALASYRASFNDPTRIAAMCEDYRAARRSIAPPTSPTWPPARPSCAPRWCSGATST